MTALLLLAAGAATGVVLSRVFGFTGTARLNNRHPFDDVGKGRLSGQRWQPATIAAVTMAGLVAAGMAGAATNRHADQPGETTPNGQAPTMAATTDQAPQPTPEPDSGRPVVIVVPAQPSLDDADPAVVEATQNDEIIIEPSRLRAPADVIDALSRMPGAQPDLTPAEIIALNNPQGQP